MRTSFSSHDTDEKLRALLHQGYKLSLSELQQYLKIGERQIRRVIDRLKAGGLPVSDYRHDGLKYFYLPEEHRTQKVSCAEFTQQELKALLLSVKAGKSTLVDTPYKLALEKIQRKLVEIVQPLAYIFEAEEELEEWSFDDRNVQTLVPVHFYKIEEAISQRRSIRIDYVTASRESVTSKDRKLDPYVLARRGQNWLLVAYCHQRQSLRNFSMARITRLVLCDPGQEQAHYTIPDSFDPSTHFRGALGVMNSDTCYEMRIRVEAEKAIYFKGKRYHPTQIIEEEDENGNLIVSFELEGFEEMRAFCQSWGIGIEVLEPIELRKRMRQEAQRLLSLYKEEDEIKGETDVKGPKRKLG